MHLCVRGLGTVVSTSFYTEPITDMLVKAGNLIMAMWSE